MAVAGSLASVRLLTELLNPAQYGELALGMTLATLVNQVIMGPICSGTLRYYSIASEQNDLRAYWHAVGRLTLWSIGIIAVTRFSSEALVIASQVKSVRPWIFSKTSAMMPNTSPTKYIGYRRIRRFFAYKVNAIPWISLS